MPALSDWEWKRRYESPPHDLAREFYFPALSRATRYDRAVGFFRSDVLHRISLGLDPFALRNGKMRILSSPANLSDADLAAINRGEEIRDILERTVTSTLASSEVRPSQLDRLRLLTWMVASGRLEFRLALRMHQHRVGLFHEKIGVMLSDDLPGESEEWLTFSGSPNETLGGMEVHAESFPVHVSWIEGQREYAVDERKRFNDVWNGEVEGIRVWSVADWLVEPMRKVFGEREPRSEDWELFPPPVTARETPPREKFSRHPAIPAMPSEMSLRDYQKSAVEKWFDQDGRGVFAMATGTGKTLTALAAATQLAQLLDRGGRGLVVLVAVPLIDLVGQWADEARKFGLDPIELHGQASASERTRARTALRLANSSSSRGVRFLITTADSLSLTETSEAAKTIHEMLNEFQGALLFIGDEMHALGTKRRLAALPHRAQFRLGLSATPKRHHDDEGTQELLDYFGEVCIRINIYDAIHKYGALVPYRYTPHFVELSALEQRRYKQLSQQIASAMASSNEDALDRAIRARTRLIAHAEHKMTVLRWLLESGLSRLQHQLVYVAEGTAEGSSESQLRRVSQMLGIEFGMKIDTYTGETPKDERPALQSRLAAGELDVLVAMKCLDEGVDIPEARIGIITASSQNPRQFVQRRGRLLRQHKQSGKTEAAIHDMIVLPPHELSNTASERGLVANELSRAAELAEAAFNAEARFSIRDAALRFQIDPSEHPWANVGTPNNLGDWTRDG